MITSFHQFLERKMQNIYDLERSLTKHRDSEGGHFHVDGDGEKPAHELLHKRTRSKEDVLKTLLKGNQLKGNKLKNNKNAFSPKQKS
jgi:hypothetical protein